MFRSTPRQQRRGHLLSAQQVPLAADRLPAHVPADADIIHQRIAVSRVLQLGRRDMSALLRVGTVSRPAHLQIPQLVVCLLPEAEHLRMAPLTIDLLVSKQLQGDGAES